MNYYQILQIDKHSTSRDIRKHYYQLAKQYHPDKNPDYKDTDSDDFKYLSEAYSVLSNPRKRYLYDLELLCKELNILNDTFQFKFSDEELILLHSYYSKLMDSTEIKFLKLLYNSIPHHIQMNLKEKLKQRMNQMNQTNKHQNKVHTLIHIQNIKYIDISKLNSDYTIHLKRNLKDVFQNLCKQILVTTKRNQFYLFITHSDYNIKIYNHMKSILTIEIETESGKYHINGHDLYLTIKINLYEYFFIDKVSLQLPDDTCYSYQRYKLNTHQINTYGLEDIFQTRGNLYIYLELDLDYPNIERYKQEIYNIFN